jgi:hypothetical protein
MAFQKGKSGNPAGRPKSSEAVKRVKEIAKDEALLALSACLIADQEGLERIEKNPKSSNAMLIMASLMRKTIEKGCPLRSQFIFNYIVGKPEPYRMNQGDSETNVIVFETQLAGGVIRTTRREGSPEIEDLIDAAMEDVCPKIESDT